MREKLRRRYQVHREVTRNGYFEGEIALSEMRRLGELLELDQSARKDRNVAVKFEFIRNEYDIATIVGRLETSLGLQCQRCLKTMELPLELDFRLMIDASDAIVQDSSVDTLYSDDGFIDIVEVVEDELILAIPLVPLHEDSACNEHWPEPETESEAGVVNNPFAVLAQLKTTSE